jgi:antitoxin HicB
MTETKPNPTRAYHVVLEPGEDRGFVVHVPAFQGCHTQGETVDEALANAREAIELNIEDMIANGEPLPVPDAVVVAA